MVLLNTVCIYMLAGLVFPDLFGEEVVDLKENFYAHRGWFFLARRCYDSCQRLQRCRFGWQIASSDESCLPSDSWSDPFRRRAYSTRTVP